ncbi:MAG: HDOD domain-containing protein [Spirochaetaceae bacterium]|nr:HDOD domain-containing protein [Spirochaetaceae bacterium]
MDITQDLVVDEVKIKKAIQSEIPLIITTFTLPHEVEIHVEQVIISFLIQIDQENLRNYIPYCVRELMNNAKKANTKRVYFLEKGLDIANPNDYDKGMTHFKENTLSNIDHYLQIQKDKGLYIKFSLRMKNNTIFIEVRNNVEITKSEFIRIYDKFARARQYTDLQEALSLVLDDSEGAGLGLVILILMLKRMGIDENSLDIVKTRKETISRLKIPLEKTRVENFSALSSAIVENINALPQFPENILKVQNLIDDPDSDIEDIAHHISRDPALTADLLKIVNSAHYTLHKKVDDITEAVKIVGIQGIKNLLISYGTQKILGEETKDKKILWRHCYKTAFYAYTLAKNFRKNRNPMNDAYVGAILHDMGKIIFSSVHPDLLNKISSFCSKKGLPASIFENLSAGMNHAEIGALIAEKWNFPENLVNSIRYHHNPSSAPEEYRELVYIVYLANMLCELEAGNVSFDQFESAVLNHFGIASKDKIENLLEKFSNEFQEENSK